MKPQVCPRCGYSRCDPRPGYFCRECGKCLGKPLTPERQQLVEKNLGLAYEVVNTRFKAVALSDGIAEVALFALCEAAARYDPNRPHPTKPGLKVRFSTYATWFVWGRLMSEMKRRRSYGFVGIPDDAEIGRVVPLSEVATRREDGADWEPESHSEEDRHVEAEHREEVQSRVEAVLRTPWLTEAERTALRMRSRGLTNEEIGAAMGCTGSWAGATIRRAIEKVREVARDGSRACA